MPDRALPFHRRRGGKGNLKPETWNLKRFQGGGWSLPSGRGAGTANGQLPAADWVFSRYNYST